MDAVRGIARSMICQLAAFHSPADLQIMIVTSAPTRWDWVKWLPHCQHPEARDGCGERRLVFTSPAESGGLRRRRTAGSQGVDAAGQWPARRPGSVGAAAVGDRRRQLRRGRGLGGRHRQARRRPGVLCTVGSRPEPFAAVGVGFDPDTTYRLSDGVLRKRVGVGYR